MHRFIAITWNRENPHAVERARRIMRSIDNGALRMQLALQTDSLTVYCATDSPESFEVYRGAGAPVVVLG
ncbi:MAG TPA: hypothetical protein VFO36_12850, partial [Nitrospiraceae bacterium]|nr:hypothetical protein [Nitrospiraceae bacterium]